jgi:hypothetical protein
MSQYSTGTATLTNNNATVTGTNTLWLANVTAGDSFTVAGDGVMYDVASVDSDTQITLSAPYAGTTASGVVYAIGTGFTVPDNFPEMSQGDIETATIFTRGMRKIQGKFSEVVSDISGKADQATTYTETEVDTLLDAIEVIDNKQNTRLDNIEVRAIILSLFGASEQGAIYVPRPIVKGTQALFQDSEGTVPVTPDGDPVGRMRDKSPNGRNAMQTISSRRPVYNVDPSRLSLDKVDDELVINVPTGGWIGTMVLATDQGTASYGVSIPAGDYNLGGEYFPGNAIVGVVFRDGALSAGEKADVEAYFTGNGAMASYGTVVDFANSWRGHSEITEFPLIDTSSGTRFYSAWRDCSSLTSFPLIDTSSGTTFRSAWYNCSSLTSFPLIDTSSGTDFYSAWRDCSSLTSFPLIDTSSGTRFPVAWYRCSSLTSFPANAFDNIKGGDFTNAFTNTALDQTSIDGILVSLVTSGITAGTFDQSGGSAPSVDTGQPAIDTLRSRGWTVTVTGGY